jgi:multiple sugar transport system substrate-binding protein
MKRIIALILSLAIIMSLGISVSAFKSVPLKSISVASSGITMKIGKTYSMKTIFAPGNTNQRNLKYSSSNTNVVTIDSKGTVKAVAAGIAVITVTSTVNKKAIARYEVVVATNKKPITLTLVETGSDVSQWNADHNSPVQKLIKTVTGVTLKQVKVSEDEFSVRLASGDLADMVRVSQANKDWGKGLIIGKKIIPLDNLVKTNGKNLTKTIPSTLAFSKAQWSQGQNKLYFVSPQVGPDQMGSGTGEMSGPTLRWDYYKEIGAPAIHNETDLLNVLKKMVANHPTSESGKKVYGISMWNDWGSPWCESMLQYYFTGQTINDTTSLGADKGAKYIDQSNANSPIWRTVKFLYDCNQAGILDPDAFTMGYADYCAKGDDGALLCAAAEWPFAIFNQAHNAEGKGYMTIPVTGGYQWHGADSIMGYSGMDYAITTKCKYQDRAMDLLNFMFSYEGSRDMYAGIAGKTWTYVNGVPTLKQSTIDASKKADAAWAATDINANNALTGLAPYTVNPIDKQYSNLFDTKQVFVQQQNPLLKSYDNFYKVSYPGEHFLKMLKAGTSKNQSGYDTLAQAIAYNPPSNINTMTIDLQGKVMSDIAKCVNAKDDADYAVQKAAAIKDFNDSGAKELFNYRSNWYNNAVKTAAKYYK